MESEKGGIKVSYYTHKEIQQILQVSTSKAYKIIRELNKQLEDMGYITIRGRVSKKYFNEKFYDIGGGYN